MSDQQSNGETSRRTLLQTATNGAMIGAVATAYAGVGAVGVRYMYPAEGRQTVWLFVSELKRMKQGDALAWVAPDGARITIARQGAGEDVDAFVALSTVCPHLGCNVHWEQNKNRFFCPCHNGVFAPDGTAKEGPPAEAGQNLSQYPLMIQDGLLFIEVPAEGLAAILEDGDDVHAAGLTPTSDDYGPPGAGHDPCLFPPPAQTCDGGVG